MRRYVLCVGACALLLLAGCSPQHRQMRAAKKQSEKNLKTQDKNAKLSPGGDLSRDNVNYKDIEKIRHRCMHINKKGKRCTYKAKKDNRYCFWHAPSHKY